MAFNVEKDWVTVAGFRAVVIMTDRGHRCGYVGVPDSHPLHGTEYSEPSAALSFPGQEPIGKRGVISLLVADSERPTPEVCFDVHGGITYSGGKEDYPTASDGLWWFGYDCAHAGDAPSDEYVEGQRKKYPDKPFMWERCFDDEHRTLDYCEAECESLALQLVNRVTGAAA